MEKIPNEDIIAIAGSIGIRYLPREIIPVAPRKSIGNIIQSRNKVFSFIFLKKRNEKRKIKARMNDVCMFMKFRKICGRLTVSL